MRQTLLCIALWLLSTLAVYAQGKIAINNDSLIRLILIEKTANIKSKKQLDSLNRELIFYKVKEDYYASSVDRLGSHFDSLYGWSLGILGILISLSGYVSLRYFDNRIKTARADWVSSTLEQKSFNDQLINNIDRIKADVYYQLGFTLYNSAGSSVDYIKHDVFINYCLKTLRNLTQSYILSFHEESLDKSSELSVRNLINDVINSIMETADKLNDEIEQIPDNEKKIDMKIFFSL